MKKFAFLVWLALVCAALACNFPVEDLPAPIFVTPTPTLDGSGVATIVPQFTPQNTPLPPGSLQTPSSTPLPTLTPLASATVQATFTALPTVTPQATSTPLPTATVTNTRAPASPTPPPTITVGATSAPTRTPTNASPGRAVFNAAYFQTPPVLDGIWDEWKDRSNEYPAGVVVWGRENWSGDADLEASFRAAWDEDYLYLAVKVKDDVYVQNAAGNNLYEGDSIEILLDTNLSSDLTSRSLSADDFQLGISPGNPNVDGAREAYLWFPRSLAGARSGVKIAAVQQNGVYRVEAAIPWSVFEVTPSSGLRLGFVLSVSDNDNGGENVQQSMVSNAPGRVLVDPTTWVELRLK